MDFCELEFLSEDASNLFSAADLAAADEAGSPRDSSPRRRAGDGDGAGYGSDDDGDGCAFEADRFEVPAAPAAPRPKKAKGVSGASTAGGVTHALSFRGASLAWCILEKHKVLENRPYRLPAGWIAIHVGKGKLSAPDEAALSARLPPGAVKPGEAALLAQWRGMVVGAFKVRECRRPSNCGGSQWASGPVCSVIEAVVRLPVPVLVGNGKLSLWPLDADACGKLRGQQLDEAQTDLSALPAFEPIVGPIGVPRKKRVVEPDSSAPGGAPPGAKAAKKPRPPQPPHANGNGAPPPAAIALS
ncbi:hypothetical protein M885DRAFT_22013 [Pelagophyceae sp. CCMP2097]|nr:hypothetical protein M885DRAFT_22013 [Pelagophyceae sp. CCMP2097]